MNDHPVGNGPPTDPDPDDSSTQIQDVITAKGPLPAVRVLLLHHQNDLRLAYALYSWATSRNCAVERVAFGMDGDSAASSPLSSRNRLDYDLVLGVATSTWLEDSTGLDVSYRARSLGRPVMITGFDLPASAVGSRFELTDLTPDSTQSSEPIAFEWAGRPDICHFSSQGLSRLQHAISVSVLNPGDFPWPPSGDTERSPYRGLRSFDVDHAGVFFGRTKPVLDALTELRRMQALGCERVFAVVGGSGSGKSSFLRAGLLARLRREDSRYRVLPLIEPRYGAISGAAGFATSLQRSFLDLERPIEFQDVHDRIISGRAGVGELLSELAELAAVRLGLHDRGPPTIVIPIDQADDLLVAAGTREAPEFCELIAGLLNEWPGELLVLTAIGADRLEAVAQLPGFAVETRRLFELPGWDVAQLRELIEGPAVRDSDAGIRTEVESSLIDRLVANFANEADSLPLLAVVLERLYLARMSHGGGLTLEAYEGLVAKYEASPLTTGLLAAAECALRDPGKPPLSLSEQASQYRALHGALIPRLAAIDPEKRVPQRHVAAFDGLPPESQAIIERLVREGLVLRRQQFVELAHDCLLRRWPVLVGWLREEQEPLTLVDGIKACAAEWERSGRHVDWLMHRDQRLRDAEALSRTPGFVFDAGSSERAYLDACSEPQQRRDKFRTHQLDERIRQAERLAEKRAQHAAHYRRMFLYSGVLGGVTALVVGGLLFWRLYATGSDNSPVAVSPTAQAVTEAGSAGVEPSGSAASGDSPARVTVVVPAVNTSEETGESSDASNGSTAAPGISETLQPPNELPMPIPPSDNGRNQVPAAQGQTRPARVVSSPEESPSRSQRPAKRRQRNHGRLTSGESNDTDSGKTPRSSAGSKDARSVNTRLGRKGQNKPKLGPSKDAWGIRKDDTKTLE